MKKMIFLSLIFIGLVGCQPSNNSAKQEEGVSIPKEELVVLKDFGPEPLVIDIEEYTLTNETFRTAIWTGENFQLTVMSIPVGGEVGLEVHYDVEQFLRVESGEAEVLMGDSEDDLNFVRKAGDDDAIFIPLGKWHNILNKGDNPLKLYSIYAKPEHPRGTVHQDKAASDADHHDH